MRLAIVASASLGLACFHDPGLAESSAQASSSTTSVDATLATSEGPTSSSTFFATTTATTATTTTTTTTTTTSTTATTTEGASSSSGGSSTGAPDPVCPPDLIPCPAFPGAQWEERDPTSLGLDGFQLSAFSSATGGECGCIARYGYIARCWGSWDLRVDWDEAGYPVWTLLLLRAIQSGQVSSLDAPIGDFDWNVTPEDAEMTLRHLANHTSGYALPEAPGEAWAYNEFGALLYGHTIFNEIYAGVSGNQLADTELGALQFEGSIFNTVDGLPQLRAFPRDVLRIGWLVANGGVWGDSVVIAAPLLAESISVGVPADLPGTVGGPANDYLGVGGPGNNPDRTEHGPGVFGYQWWVNTSGKAFPSAPHDTLVATNTWNENTLTVIPSRGIVAAWCGDGSNDNDFLMDMNALLGQLLAAAD